MTRKKGKITALPCEGSGALYSVQQVYEGAVLILGRGKRLPGVV